MHREWAMKAQMGSKRASRRRAGAVWWGTGGLPPMVVTGGGGITPRVTLMPCHTAASGGVVYPRVGVPAKQHRMGLQAFSPSMEAIMARDHLRWKAIEWEGGGGKMKKVGVCV